MNDFIDLSQATPTEPDWVIKGVIPVGLTIIGGLPKTLKSLFTYGLAANVAGYKNGILPASWETTKKGPVCMISHEATPGDIAHVFRKDCGIELREDESIMVASDPDDFMFDQPGGMQALLSKITPEDEDRIPQMVILDPFRDCHSQDENDSAAMIAMARPLQKWARKHRTAVVMVHHSRKGQEQYGQSSTDPNALRGSVALFGKADGVIMLAPYGVFDARKRMSARFKRGKAFECIVEFGVPGWSWEKQGSIYEEPKKVRNT